MPRILIIEDDPQIRANLRRFLALEGYEAVAAANGEEGLALARAALPDLILCDVMMPGMDGFAVLQALKADPETAAVPFVFLTASAEHESVRHGLRAGAAEYIVKPFNLSTVAEVVARRLAGG